MTTPPPLVDRIVLANRIHLEFTPPPTSTTGNHRKRRVRTKPLPNAVAFSADRVVAVGTKTDILELRTRGTDVLQLRGATLTPGLVDSHTHFFYWALGESLLVDVSPCTSLDSTLRTIATRAQHRRIGPWVVAHGFDHNRWKSPPPQAADLDRILPDIPVLVHSRDHHTVWLNSAGLRAARLDRNTPDPPGGNLERNATGELTGLIRETAIELLPDPVRLLAGENTPAAHRVIDRALYRAYERAWAHGITAVHSMDDGLSLTHLQRHHARGALGLRVVHAIPLAELPAARRLGLRSGLGDRWLRLGGVKIFSDGALGSQTAYMFDAYPGRPGYCGVPVISGDPLRAAVAEAVAAGWCVWIHAIGDRAVKETVDALVSTRRDSGASLPMPHRIEHAQCVRPADARRMARAGIIASVQPCHIPGDIATAQRHWPRAQRNAYPFRRLLDAGAILAAGSDIPVESIDPRRSLHGAVCRTDESGQPAGGWVATERLSVSETLWAFTRGAAASVGLSEPAGTLRPGAAADATVWDDDPLAAAPGELLQLGLRGAIVAGSVHAQ